MLVQAKSRFDQIFGIMCAILAALLWSFFAMVSKQIYITSNISPFDMVYFRCFVPLVISMFYIVYMRINILKISKEIAADFTIRCLSWAILVILNFISMKIMTLSRYTIILFTGPIFTSIFGYFMLGDKLSIYDFVSCISSFIGVIIVATNPNSQKKSSVMQDEPWWAFLCPLISAIITGMSDNIQRRISTKIDKIVLQSWLYMATMCIAPMISFGFHSYESESFRGFSIVAIILLIVHGFIGIIAINFYMLSLKYEKAGRAAAVNYLQIVFISMIDVFYFGLSVDLRDILGAILIIACSFTITFLKAFDIIS